MLSPTVRRKVTLVQFEIVSLVLVGTVICTVLGIIMEKSEIWRSLDAFKALAGFPV